MGVTLSGIKHTIELRRITMHLNLDVKYGLKTGEHAQFLDADAGEQGRLKSAVRDAVGSRPEGQREDEAANAARDAFYAGLGLGARVSSYLLRTAVEMRYKTDQGVVIPRREAAKRRPGVWWGAISRQLDARPQLLQLSAEQALWLLKDVWDDDKVQNGFPPALQAWVNALDESMEQLRAELDGAGVPVAGKAEERR